MMELQITEHIIRVQVIAISGRLDAFNAPDLRQKFQTLLAQGSVRYVLDLHDLTFMDSAAMAALVSLLKQARTAGGAVNMVKPQSEAALRILTLTKFDKVFAMSDTVDLAIQQVLT